MKKIIGVALLGFMSAVTSALASPSITNITAGFIYNNIEPNEPVFVSTSVPFKVLRAVCTTNMQPGDGTLTVTLNGQHSGSMGVIKPGSSIQLKAIGGLSSQSQGFSYVFQGTWDANISHPSSTVSLYCHWV